jgi:hypothetical protein
MILEEKNSSPPFYHSMSRSVENTFENFFSTFSRLCFLFGSLIFVVLPMRAVQTWLNHFTFKVSNYYNLALFVLLTGCIGSHLLARILRNSHLKGSCTTEQTISTRKPWLLIAFQIIASLYLIVRTTHEVLTGPLDTDESYISAELSQPHPQSVIDPRLSTRNHALSTLAGFFSSRLFGLNEITIRYPSLIFTAFFLIILNLYCLRYASPFTTLLVFTHLSVNQLTLWYFHSMRGYVAMMAFTLSLLYLTRRALDEKKITKLQFATLILVTILAAFSHTFGGFFVICLMLGLLGWLAFQKENHPNVFRQTARLTAVLGLALPLIALIALSQANAIKALGLFNTGKLPDFSFETLRVLGIPGRQWAVLAWFLVAALVISPWTRRLRRSPSLISSLLLSSFVFILGLVWALEVVILEGRMLLALLIPFLLWVGSAIENIEETLPRRSLMVYATLVLVLVPLTGKPELYNVNPEILSDYKQFIRRVREATQRGGPACFTTSGAPWAVKWTEGLYLADRMASKAKDCRTYYHLFFEAEDPPQTLRPPSQGFYRLLFVDGGGRHLYQHVL